LARIQQMNNQILHQMDAHYNMTKEAEEEKERELTSQLERSLPQLHYMVSTQRSRSALGPLDTIIKTNYYKQTSLAT
jgi:hypothetical protein